MQLGALNRAKKACKKKSKKERGNVFGGNVSFKTTKLEKKGGIIHMARVRIKHLGGCLRENCATRSTVSAMEREGKSNTTQSTQALPHILLA